MFSLPFYLAGDAGLDADFDRLFHWLALALTTPVVLYAAQPSSSRPGATCAPAP